MEFETVLQSDLSKPVQVKQLTGNLFSGDNRGNKITVEVFDNGSPATLTGDVSGYVIRADGKTVVIADTQGTNYTEKDGNRVSVILPQSAYVVVGQVSIVIKVGTVTVGACTSYVYKSTTDQQIDPGSVIPDISTLMGIIEDCIGATEAAESATLAASSAASLATLAAQSAINIATVATQSMSAQVGAKITEINSAIIASSSATAAANTAASGANSAKTAANSAATSANTAALAAQSATSQAIAAAGSVNSAIIAASSATAHAETSALAATSAAAYAIEVADGIEPEIIRLDGTKSNTDSTFAYKETYGSVVEFDDGVSEAVKRMDIAIAPLQDLHGYDHPWVGGAGKNLLGLNMITTASTYTTITSITNGVKISNSKSATYRSTLTPTATTLGLVNGQTYTFSAHAKVTSGAARLAFRRTSDNGVIVQSSQLNSGEGDLSVNYTFNSEVPAYASMFCTYDSAASGEVEYTNIQVEEGSTATTYEPYSNICPISGWTEANVTRVGRNVLNISNSQSMTHNSVSWVNNGDDSWTANGTATGGDSYPVGIKMYDLGILPSGVYSVSVRDAFGNILNDIANVRVGYGSDSTLLVSAKGSATFTADGTTNYYFSFNIGTGGTANNLTIYPQVEAGSVVTPYVAPKNTYTVPFPTSAGTVYGGTLTVNQDGTGSLIVDRFSFKTTSDIISADANITTIAQRTNTLKFWIYGATLPENAGILSSGDPLICDRLPTNVGDVNTYDLVGAQSSSSYSRSYCLSIPTGLCGSTASEIRAYINANPYQFCMKLKSTVSYELTTDQVVRLLSGQNTVYADCGEITLLYPTDKYLTAEQAERERIHESIAVSAPVQTIDDGADNVPMALEIAIEPVQEGTGDPSPSNIRPIIGCDKAEVTRTGKNLFDGAENGAIDQTTGNNTASLTAYRTINHIRVSPNGQYTISGLKTATGSIRVFYYKADKKYYSNELKTASNNNITLTVGSDIQYIRFQADESVFDNTTSIQLEVGSATTYAPYNGQTYSITFPSSAGTVYGGSLTVNKDGTGTLTVDYLSFAVKDVVWTYDSTYTRFYHDFSDIMKVYVTRKQVIKSSCFLNPHDGEAVADVPDKSIYNGGANKYIYIKDTEHSTVASFTEAYGDQTFLVELATPVTYAIPAPVIRSLLGTNNIFCDTGNVLSVDYSADTKLYIDNLTKPTEDDMIANENIPTDTYFTINNTLYKSTEAIAQGETINPNTDGNCVATSVAEVFNSLLSAEGVSF